MNWPITLLASICIGKSFGQMIIPLHGHTINLQKRGVNVNLYNLQDVFLLGEIEVANKTFNLVFDTGSADFFVKNEICTLGSSSNILTDTSCKNIEGLNTTSSLLSRITIPQPVNLLYHSGSAIADVYSTAVKFGNISIPEMVIGVGNKLRKLEYFDGIVGLGFPSRSQIGQALENPTFNRYYLKWNFIDNMFKQMAGQISEYQFGIYVSNSDNYEDSEIAIGGKNPLKYKGFPKTFFTVTDPGSVWAIDSNPWTIQVLDVSMPRPLANNRTIVSIDTGSSAIFLHNKTAHIINAQLGATFNVTDGRDYFPDCNVTDKHDVVLKANGFTFNIPPRNLYVPDFNNRTRCLSAIVRTEDTKPVVLGIAFLRSYYSVYTLGSKPSITFYDSIHDLNYGIQVLKQHIESLELQIQVRNKYQFLFPEDGSFDFVEDVEKKLEDYRNRLKIHELRMKSASLKLSL